MKRFLTIFIGGALLVAIIVGAFIFIHFEDRRLIRIKAALGNPQAQSRLGNYYYFVSKDKDHLVKARKWFEKAAQQDDFDAQTFLTIMLSRGEGGEVNKEEAHKWLWRSILPKNSGNVKWSDNEP